MDTPKAHFDFLQGAQELSTNDGIGSALGASATFTGKTWDCAQFASQLNSPGNNLAPQTPGKAAPAYFRVAASADQTGTLNVQHSPDGTNWFTDATATASIPAGFTKVTIVEAMVVMRYVRVQFVNGATAQTHVEIDTALVSR